MTLLEHAEAAAGRLPIPARRRVFRVGYFALQCGGMIRRPHTAGVKVVLRRGDDVLLVRHTYGRRSEWDLPGGFLNEDEDPQDAALREIGEELGLRAQRPVALGRDPCCAARAGATRGTASPPTRTRTPRPGRRRGRDRAGALVRRTMRCRRATSDYTRRMVARAYWEMFRE